MARPSSRTSSTRRFYELPLPACRGVAGYVDRLLKGGTPANLPLQFADKYELVINLPIVRALGLEVSPTLPARAAM
jgi:hypothetical protein